MSAQEIIAELPKLRPEELRQVDAKLHELLPAEGGHKHWGEALLEIAGSVKDLPADYSENLDHYLYGLPKK
jgi:hypothetical protein